ncbi:MAG: LacI family DNA-binding transcriptional regulator [Anaerolineae bacterium]
MAEKLTIRQVAKLAGVSRSTVSRVLNDHPYVNPETREHVLQVIAETGFRPDPIARSLSGRNAGMIGFVIPLANQSLFEHPLFPYLVQSISRGCSDRDYTLTIFFPRSLEEEARLYRRISHRQFLEGLIVADTHTRAPLISELFANKIPFVLRGRHDDPRVSFVDVDDVGGAYRAVTHLMHMDRRRIALVTGPQNSVTAEDRKQGYLKALRERGISVDEALMIHGDYTEASGYEAMQRLLPYTPDAVFAASDLIALGCLAALHEEGTRVPEEVALVGFEDLPQAVTADPHLTTVRQPIQRAGALAVEMLIDVLENGAESPQRRILPTELVVRASCGSRLGG